jgi:hypothetical protein
MDVNLVKIDKLIDINRARPVSFRQFSASIVPATVSAAGFNLSLPIDKFSRLNWFMTLKLVNASKENLIVENIQAEWIGENNYRCKSIYEQIYEVNQGDEDKDEVIINQLNEKENPKRKTLFLPILLKPQSEKIIRVDFLLETYKRTFFNHWLPVSFKKEEIKEPDTYQQLLQSAVIKIKINESRGPLLIKI